MQNVLMTYGQLFLLLYFQRFCADIISVLGMTFSDNKESLKYRLLGSKEAIGSWGHEYVRLDHPYTEFNPFRLMPFLIKFDTVRSGWSIVYIEGS